jgi:hypothetical protein
MPTLLSTFAAGEYNMAFRERFVTEALNRKSAVSVPSGVYRGFRIETEGVANNTITIKADPTYLDHVAVYETENGFSLTVRSEVGDFDLDLSSLVDVVDVTAVIAVVADYAIGSVTTATVQAYTLDPVDELTGAAEQDAVVILGTVVIPASSAAPLPAANVTPAGFRAAWEEKTSGSRQWTQVVRNASFDVSSDPVGAADNRGIANWRIDDASGVLFTTDALDPRSGHRAVGVTFPVASSSGTLTQNINVPVREDSYVRLQFFKKTTVDDLTGGTVTAQLVYGDETGAEIGTTSDFDIDMSAVDVGYVELGGVVKVPTGGRTLLRIVFAAVTTTGPAENIKLYIDDVRVWVEDMSGLSAEDRASDYAGDIWTSGVIIQDQALDQTTGIYGGDACILEYVEAGNLLAFLTLDGSGAINIGVEDVTANGNIYGTILDGAALDIITTAGDAVDIATTGTGSSIDIDHATIAPAIDIAMTGSTGNGLKIVGSGSTSDLVALTVNAGDNAGIFLTHAGDDDALIIDNNSTNRGILINLGAVGSQAMVVTEGAFAQTTPMISLTRNAAAISTSAHVIDIQQSGNGIGINVNMIGGGEAMRLTSAASDDCLFIDHNGSGASGVSVSMAGNLTGNGYYATMSTSSGDGLFVDHDGSGAGVEIDHDGTGYGAYINNAGSNYGLYVVNATTSQAVYIDQNGSGIGLEVQKDGTANVALHVDQNTASTGINLDVTSGLGMDIDASTGTSDVIDIFSSRTGGITLDVSATSMTSGHLFQFSGQASCLFEYIRYGRMRNITGSGSTNSGALSQETQGYTSFASTAKQLTVNRAGTTAYNFMAMYANSGSDISWRVNGNGQMFADIGTVGTPADYAEYVEMEQTTDNYEAGDVLVFSGNDGTFDKSTTANSALVAGIYSTDPFILGNNSPGCSGVLYDPGSGTLEDNNWVMRPMGDDDEETMFNLIQFTGIDLTARYPVGAIMVFNGKTAACVTAVAFSNNKTLVTIDHDFPAPIQNVDLHYGFALRQAIPMAMMGQVPCKVIAENGTISPGDMLVTSSTPGHAMKAGGSPAVGTILGKALSTLTDMGGGTNTATIMVYVNIH